MKAITLHFYWWMTPLALLFLAGVYGWLSARARGGMFSGMGEALLCLAFIFAAIVSFFVGWSAT